MASRRRRSEHPEEIAFSWDPDWPELTDPARPPSAAQPTIPAPPALALREASRRPPSSAQRTAARGAMPTLADDDPLRYDIASDREPPRNAFPTLPDSDPLRHDLPGVDDAWGDVDPGEDRE